jgi:hypothetical protein
MKWFAVSFKSSPIAVFEINRSNIFAAIGHGGESDATEEGCGGLPGAGDRHQWGSTGGEDE